LKTRNKQAAARVVRNIVEDIRTRGLTPGFYEQITAASENLFLGVLLNARHRMLEPTRVR